MEGAPAAFRDFATELQAEQRRLGDLRDAVGTAGQRGVIQQQNAHDLAEAERDDRQIVAAQTQHRKAEQQPEERRDDARQRQTLPEAEAEVVIQQREGVGADGVEAAVAEHQQARKADHHVESETEHHVDQRQRGDIHRAARNEKGPGHRHDDQREHKQLLLRRRAVDAGQHQRRTRNLFQAALPERTQQLKEKDHAAADENPVPAHLAGALHHQAGAVEAEAHAHKEAGQHQQHHGGE